MLDQLPALAGVRDPIVQHRGLAGRSGHDRGVPGCDEAGRSVQDYAQLGESYFYTIIGMGLALVMLVSLAATAGAICVARAAGTLDHILVTDLSDAKIALDKLGTRLLPVFGLVACSWQVMAIRSALVASTRSHLSWRSGSSWPSACSAARSPEEGRGQERSWSDRINGSIDGSRFLSGIRPSHAYRLCDIYGRHDVHQTSRVP